MSAVSNKFKQKFIFYFFFILFLCKGLINGLRCGVGEIKILMFKIKLVKDIKKALSPKTAGFLKAFLNLLLKNNMPKGQDRRFSNSHAAIFDFIHLQFQFSVLMSTLSANC